MAVVPEVTSSPVVARVKPRRRAGTERLALVNCSVGVCGLFAFLRATCGNGHFSLHLCSCKYVSMKGRLATRFLSSRPSQRCSRESYLTHSLGDWPSDRGPCEQQCKSWFLGVKVGLEKRVVSVSLATAGCDQQACGHGSSPRRLA